jgi:rhamnose utilization protein RhaD (predicted bifunctional aldolase and dehydrogenase)
MAAKAKIMTKIECMVSERMLDKLDVVAKVDGVSRNEAIRTVLKEGFDSLDMAYYMREWKTMMEDDEDDDEEVTDEED